MSYKVKKSILSVGFISALACGIVIAQETKETVIVTQPDAATTKSVVVTTPSPSGTTTTSVTTPAPSGGTTTTKETVVTTPTQRQVIVTPVPQAKEVVVAPSGFVNCFTVASGWFNNEWIPQHQICQYANSPEGASWVEGYWACTKYRMSEGICTNWDWRPGHWAKTLVIY